MIDEVTDHVTVGEVTNDNDAVEGFVVEIAKDDTGSIVKAEAPITTGTMVQRQAQCDAICHKISDRTELLQRKIPLRSEYRPFPFRVTTSAS